MAKKAVTKEVEKTVVESGFKMSDLQENHIVLMRNGHVATVEFWNKKPARFMTRAYNKKASTFTEDMTYSSRMPTDDYDIMKVFDGSSITNVDNVFSTRFDVNQLPVVWERK